MTSATPAKFTFDLDLTGNAEKSQSIGEIELAEKLKRAEDKGYARGLSEGEASVQSQAHQSVAIAASDLATRSIELARAADQALEQYQADAVNLAIDAAKKLAAHSIAQKPLVEIEALMAECMGALENVPHLVIRCHPDLADPVRELAEQHMSTSGFSGRLVIMGEPEIGLGDARFEWVEGGLVRDMEKISNDITQRVRDFLGLKAKPTETEITEFEPETESAQNEPEERHSTEIPDQSPTEPSQ